MSCTRSSRITIAAWAAIVPILVLGVEFTAGRTALTPGEGLPTERVEGGATLHHVSKLVAPLEIAFEPLPRRQGDVPGVRRLRIQVTPQVDAPRMDVRVTLPAGVTLLEGERRWSRPARARQAESRELALKVPPSGERRIVVTARLLAPRTLPKTRTASYTYNAAGAGGRPGTTVTTPLPAAPGRAIRRAE